MDLRVSNMNGFFKNVKAYFIAPFVKDFPFFFTLFLFSSIVDIIAWWLHGERLFSIYFGLHGFVLCYILCIFSQSIGCNIIRKSYNWLLVFFGCLNVIIDISCHIKLHTGFAFDMVGIIMSTNSQEASEFVEFFFDWNIILCSISVIGLIYIIQKVLKRNSYIGYKLRYWCIALVLIGVFATIMKDSKNWGRIYILKPFSLASYERPPALKDYYSNILVSVDSTLVPQNVVIIIGESFNKKHSSLYGYEKNTNPLLKQLQKDSMLYVHKNVQSSGTHTIECFQKFMTININENVKWYEKPSIIEILQKAGYNVTWISNQSKKGGYDNVVTRYAEICDSMIFVGNHFQGTNRDVYDEEILKYLPSKQQCEDRKCYIFHLMGSHYVFEKRYPMDFGAFYEKDYLEFPKGQRAKRATYDNSILYNDSIVNEIIRHFENDDVLIYYFSDHAIDVYMSSDSYVGHATSDSTSEYVSKQIPFMMYVSKSYKGKHYEKCENFYNRIDTTIDMNYFGTLLFRDIGVEFAL